MTDLAPPTIVGPVSDCQTSISLTNIVVLPGVTVQISIGGQPRPPVPTSATTMTIATGPLTAGNVLSARQFGGGFGGDWLPTGSEVKVGHGPSKASDVNPPALIENIYECASCVLLANIIPGAVVTVTDANNKVLGTGVGEGGSAVVFFGTPATASPLRATQSICGYTASAQLPALLPPPPQPLASPKLSGPILRCQPSVPLSGLLLGALVEVRVFQPSGTVDSLFCATASAGTIRDLPPLDINNFVQVTQTLGNCAPRGSWSTALVVIDSPVPVPQLAQSICQTDSLVHITNVTDGAFIELDYGGPEPIVVQSTGSTCDANIPTNTFVNSVAVRARQRFSYAPGCEWSDYSPSAQVVPEIPATPPQIETPIFQCGTKVRLHGVAPGGWVGVEDVTAASDVGTPTYALKDTVDVTIPVGVVVGHSYRAFEIRCGVRMSGPIVVALPFPSRFGPFLPPYTPHIKDPILDCGSIHISNIVPGAIVDVFVNTGKGLSYYDSFPSPTTKLSVERPSGLVAAAAAQHICATYSATSNIAAVASGSVVRGALTTVCELTMWPMPDVASGSEMLIGTDLGIPVEHGGQLYLLFGDANVAGTDPNKQVKPIFRVAGGPECPVLDPLPGPPPNSDPCAAIASHEAESNIWFESLVVDNLPLTHFCNVPSGAFSYNGKMYVFVTQLVANAQPVTTGDGAGCANAMTSSYLVSRSAMCETFQVEFPVDGISDASGTSMRFINIAARVLQNNGQIPELPNGDLLLLWGTGLYRGSSVYFAYVQLQSGQPIPGPSQWHYLTQAAPPAFTQGLLLPTYASYLDPVPLLIPPALTSIVADGGEIAVAWIPGLARWLLLVTSKQADGLGFLAPKPWGPWTAVKLFDSTADAVFDVTANKTVELTPLPHSGTPFGWGYGNYVIDRYSVWNADSDTASVYIVSSANLRSSDMPPNGVYGTFLMRVELECGP